MRKTELLIGTVNYLQKLRVEKIHAYIIYADNCLLTTDFLQSKQITFKKIPREIPRI